MDQSLEAAPAVPPTASLTASPLGEANPTSTLVVDIAAQVVFTWVSSNATQATSWYTVDSPDTCTSSDTTGPFPWIAETLTGTYTVQYMTCQQGHTYTYYFVAQNSTGQTTQSTVVVSVNKNGTD